MELTPFSNLTSAMQTDGDHQSIHLPPDWLQGRTAYGGLSAALCLEATLRVAPELPALRSAQFCFIGPATGQLTICPSILRKGKSTVVMAVDLLGDSGLAVRATMCFGIGRESAHHHQSFVMPTLHSPDTYPSYYEWPSRPNFMNHFEGRLAQGALPGTPGMPPEMTVWLRHRERGDESSLVRLMALADALPPAAMVMSTVLHPISTMTWSIDMLDSQPATSDGWWLVKATADTSAEGYSAQSTVVWNSDGKPVLVARQNVAIFG
jgi:acyl-CoA thioesterase